MLLLHSITAYLHTNKSKCSDAPARFLFSRRHLWTSNTVSHLWVLLWHSKNWQMPVMFLRTGQNYGSRNLKGLFSKWLHKSCCVKTFLKFAMTCQGTVMLVAHSQNFNLLPNISMRSFLLLLLLFCASSAAHLKTPTHFNHVKFICREKKPSSAVIEQAWEMHCTHF